MHRRWHLWSLQFQFAHSFQLRFTSTGTWAWDFRRHRGKYSNRAEWSHRIGENNTSKLRRFSWPVFRVMNRDSVLGAPIYFGWRLCKTKILFHRRNAAKTDSRFDQCKSSGGGTWLETSHSCRISGTPCPKYNIAWIFIVWSICRSDWINVPILPKIRASFTAPPAFYSNV